MVTQTETQKPVDKKRLGSISASIWRNQTDQGVIYNTTIQRSYKDKNDQWQNAESFDRDDLLLVAKIADWANTRIFEMQAEDRNAEG